MSFWKAGMTYLCSFGLVGAHAQPIVLGIQASSVPAIEPNLLFPYRLPARMVSLSNNRIPLPLQVGQPVLGGILNSVLQTLQILLRLSVRNLC